MNKHLKARVFLTIAVAVTALFSTDALYAKKDKGGSNDSAKKVNICHFPPGNRDNVHAISISVNALKTHEDHHDDYLVDSAGIECFAEEEGEEEEVGEEVGVEPGGSEPFEVKVCVNSQDKPMGRKVKTSLTGLISSSPWTSCES